MKRYVKRKAENTATESSYINGKWKDKFFYLYCDICGLRYGDRDIIVQELCEEEGFPDGDYCDECQYCMHKQGFVGEDKSIYFLKKNYPK